MNPNDPATQIRLEACGMDVPLTELVEKVFTDLLPARGFPLRPHQLTMALHVAENIDPLAAGDGRTYACEAPTGSGKSLAYLIPAVLAVLRHRFAMGRPEAQVVVSTSNIALQRQIVKKDLDTVSDVLRATVTRGVLKSRANYVCNDRLEQAVYARIRGDIALIDRIADWMKRGGSGDKEDIPVRISPATWGEVSIDSAGCILDKCPHADECPSTLAKRQAATAAVLVVNHHYLAAASRNLLEHAVALIVDEAHDLEESLRGTNGLTIHEKTAERWKRRMEQANLDGTPVYDAVRKVWSVASSHFRGRDIRLEPGWLDEAGEDEVTKALTRQSLMISGAKESAAGVEEARLQAAGRRLNGLKLGVGRVIQAKADVVAWVEPGRSGASDPVLQSAPLQVSLPAKAKSMGVVLCSATMGDPAATARSVGLDPHLAERLPSSFDLERQALAIVPRGAPDPKSARWDAYVEASVVEFVSELGGGVLALATSWEAKRNMATALSAAGFDVREQGDAGRSELLEWKAANPDSVLVGTRSFFQGVDIQGKALRGVVVDKIPFPAPSPLEDAIRDLIKVNGGHPFRVRSMGVAITVLRQAVGRLIRSVDDRGAVLLCDGRFTTQSYGKVIYRKAVAPIPLSRNIEDAGRLWRGERTHAVTSGRHAIG